MVKYSVDTTLRLRTCYFPWCLTDVVYIHASVLCEACSVLELDAFVLLCCPKICQHARFYDTCYRSLGLRIRHSPLSVWSGHTCISYQETRQATRSVRHVITENFGNILLCIPNCELFVLSFWWDLFPSHFWVSMLEVWQLAIGSLERARFWLSKPCLAWLFELLDFATDEFDRVCKMGYPPILHVEGYSILLF